MLPYFNLDDYTQEDVVMHCPDEDSADIFTEYLHEHGRKWNNGDTYLNNAHYETMTDRTCYAFNTGMYSRRKYYEENNYLILNFYDFEWDALNPNQSDLEPPMSFDDMFLAE